MSYQNNEATIFFYKGSRNVIDEDKTDEDDKNIERIKIYKRKVNRNKQHKTKTKHETT